MLSHALYLVMVTCIATLSSAIRVDWNTNKGPIVPPTPRTTVRPQPPFRAPAPVWEAQSNDIPNPKPYVYVLPPPSRPGPDSNNYLTSDRQPVSQANYYKYNNYKNRNYGILLSPNDANAYRAEQSNNGAVAGLAVKHVPTSTLGKQYYAIVSGGNKAKAGTYYSGAAGGDKVQGKYNAKTKKYKAYEKLKYNAPLPNYFTVFPFERREQRPTRHYQQQQFDQQQWTATTVQQQQQQNVEAFRAAAAPTTRMPHNKIGSKTELGAKHDEDELKISAANPNALQQNKKS